MKEFRPKYSKFVRAKRHADDSQKYYKGKSQQREVKLYSLINSNRDKDEDMDGIEKLINIFKHSGVENAIDEVALTLSNQNIRTKRSDTSSLDSRVSEIMDAIQGRIHGLQVVTTCRIPIFCLSIK
jgi:hypothetical protein